LVDVGVSEAASEIVYLGLSYYKVGKNCTHSKQCWVVSTKIWVKYGQTQMLG